MDELTKSEEAHLLTNVCWQELQRLLSRPPSVEEQKQGQQLKSLLIEIRSEITQKDLNGILIEMLQEVLQGLRQPDDFVFLSHSENEL